MGDSPRPPICIVVPFDILPDLAATLLRSLEARKEELKDLRCTLILISGAGETDSLRKAKEFLADVPVVFLQNEENFGFVPAVNLGLKHAVDRSCDVVILRSA